MQSIGWQTDQLGFGVYSSTDTHFTLGCREPGCGHTDGYERTSDTRLFFRRASKLYDRLKTHHKEHQ